mmetsp:Transcript_43616/g.113635  ORF Transcript_43616/g.113635 Transcript_43616/m.113635 type:complete len:165 (+) Transcript_43616:454-948(+)
MKVLQVKEVEYAVYQAIGRTETQAFRKAARRKSDREQGVGGRVKMTSVSRPPSSTLQLRAFEQRENITLPNLKRRKNRSFLIASGANDGTIARPNRVKAHHAQVVHFLLSRHHLFSARLTQAFMFARHATDGSKAFSALSAQLFLRRFTRGRTALLGATTVGYT